MAFQALNVIGLFALLAFTKMGTLISTYVRVSSQGAAAVLQRVYASAYTEAGSEFYAIDQPRGSFRCPDEDLRALSEELRTDVIWLSFQSVVDAFQYHHWRDGAHLRSLVYGSFEERVWERVTGNAEPWEAAVFFDSAALTQELKYTESSDDRLRLKHVFQEQVLTPGDTIPRVDARERARDIAKFFRFPGWA